MKRKLLPAVIIVVAFVVMFMLFGLRQPPEKKEEVKKDLLVEVVPAIRLQDNLKVNSQGTVEPKIKSTLVSEVSGKITWVSPAFVNGGLFKKGETLIKVDARDYQTSLKTAEANLARAEATLEEEKARAKVAEKEWREFMQGDAPDLYLRKPQLARELANVKAAQADVERAKRELARTNIKASFNGLVKQKQADLGQFVNKGTPVADLYGTDTAEIRLPVSDLDVSFLSFDSAYELKLQQPKVELSSVISGEEKSWLGTIVRSEGVIDTRTRMVYLVAEIHDPYGIESAHSAIEFGRFVQADIIGKQVENLVLMPRDLIFQEDKAIIANGNVLEIRNVTISKLDKRYAYVSKGLSAGELLISTNIKNPLAGASIRILQEEIADSAEQGTN
jgi:RND family efflux transporter MFP subunit